MQAAPAAIPAAGAPPAELREHVRDTLTGAPGFGKLDEADRREIAHSLVRIAHAASLFDDEAKPTPKKQPAARAMNAADEYGGTAVNKLASTTEATLKAISFPRFVNELITGVFKAILESNQQQLQQYLDLIKGVSASLDGFDAVAGSDGAAMKWLVEQFPGSFEIEMPDPEDIDPEEPPEPPRLRSKGSMPSDEALRAAFGLGPEEELPSGGPTALVPFARRALAKSRQQMLASMVMMGMQRIVIEGGRISAGMRFHIDARSAAREDTSSQFDTRTEVAASGSVGFGFWSMSASLKQNIGYVSTKAVSTTEELNASADLNSQVELQFRTDQVPLDRLAAASTVERLKLNTLNPTREMELAAEADKARAAARADVEKAYAARPPATSAPSTSLTPPTLPTVTPRQGQGGAQGGGGGQGGGGANQQQGQQQPRTQQQTQQAQQTQQTQGGQQTQQTPQQPTQGQQQRTSPPTGTGQPNTTGTGQPNTTGTTSQPTSTGSPQTTQTQQTQPTQQPAQQQPTQQQPVNPPANTAPPSQRAA